MRLEEAGCYLEINMATGNIDRIATDPVLLEHHSGEQGINIEEACGGFCQHSRPRCQRIRSFEPEVKERRPDLTRGENGGLNQIRTFRSTTLEEE